MGKQAVTDCTAVLKYDIVVLLGNHGVYHQLGSMLVGYYLALVLVI